MTATLLNRALRLRRQHESDEQQKRLAEDREDHVKIVQIYLKGDAATDADIAALAEISLRRGLSDARIEAFTGAIEQAREFSALHGQCKSARERSRAAQEAKQKASDELVKAKEAAREAAADAERAVHFVNQCGNAAVQLRRLSKEFPQLFDVSGDVPKLLGSE